MSEEPNPFAGLSAAFSALRVQIAALVKTGAEEATRRMDTVKRAEFDALAARITMLEAAKSPVVAEPPDLSGGATDVESDKFIAG